MADNAVREMEMRIGGKTGRVHYALGQPLDAFIRQCVAPRNPDRVVLMSDNRVFVLYGRKLEAELLRAGFPTTSIVLEPGEVSKSIETLDGILGNFLDAGLSRRSLVVGLGGGVVSDVTGFAASVYLRGIPFVLVPTSLLAQADTAISGKVALNHWSWKNLLGTYACPQDIWIDPAFLETLLEAEFVNGFIQILKHALTLSPALCKRVMDLPSLEAARQNPELLQDLLFQSIQAKLAVIAQDGKDPGFRRVLNFGYSFGYALEMTSGFSGIKPGGALGWGMIMAQNYGQRNGCVPADWAEASSELVRRLIPLPSLVAVKAEDVFNLAWEDRKFAGRKRFLVFSTGPGAHALSCQTDDDIGLKVIDQFVGSDRTP